MKVFDWVELENNLFINMIKDKSKKQKTKKLNERKRPPRVPCTQINRDSRDSFKLFYK